MPSYILDENKWEKAKEIVEKEYGLTESDGSNFWALTMGVYKKMKGRFKKKSSRLEKVSNELTNKQYEIEDYYSSIQEEINTIRDELNTIESYLDEINQENYDEIADYIVDSMNYILSCNDRIYDFASKAKSIGQFNEDMLREGKSIIEDLESEIDKLKVEIDDIINSKSEVEYEIYELEDEIERIKELIDNIENELSVESDNNNRKRLITVLGSFQYICHVHDDIMEIADRIADIINSSVFVNKIKDYDSEKFDDLYDELISEFNDIKNDILNYLSDIEHDMSIGLDMNNRMGAGIDRKNDLIQELKEEVENLVEELGNLSYEYDDLLSQKEELESQLAELQSLL